MWGFGAFIGVALYFIVIQIKSLQIKEFGDGIRNATDKGICIHV